MYISHFAISNFLNHRSTAISFDPLNVFVGPNGAGKSAMFEALINFSIVARGPIAQAFGDYAFSYEETKFHGASAAAPIRFDVSLRTTQKSPESLRYELNYKQNAKKGHSKPTFSIPHEKLTLIRGDTETLLFDRADPDTSPLKCAKYIDDDRSIFAAARYSALRANVLEDEYKIVNKLATQISKVGKFRLTPNRLSSSSRVPEVLGDKPVPPRIGYLGDDLAAALYFMQERSDPRLEKIIEKVRGVDSAFAGFSFTFVGSDQLVFSITFDDSRGTVSAIRLSDGLLIFLGLMVLAYNPEHLPIVLIEEPENGLTPVAIRHFYEAIRELSSDSNAELRSQVLISSHSPFVICEGWNGEDRDFIHRVEVINGAAQVKTFNQIVKDHQVVLSKEGGLSLKNAEDVMCGRYLGEDALAALSK
jgi:predicted ATPase